MGIFSGKNMQSRHSGAGGKFAPEGRYRVRIDKCFENKGYKGESAIVEYTVTKVFSLKDPKAQVAIGEDFSWVNNVTKHGDAALGNIADFVRAICHTVAAKQGQVIADPKTIPFTDADCEVIYSEQSPYVGIELDLEVYIKKTKDKNDFTMHVWTCPPELLGQPAPQVTYQPPAAQAQA